MVFVLDEGSVFEMPLDEVWAFVDSGDEHAAAHHHRNVSRERPSPTQGVAHWEQEFEGRTEPFTMRWTSLHPLGCTYQVLEGPFAGSVFFLYYTPLGPRTGVTVVGHFVSPSIPEADLEAAVRRFFSVEFDQDHLAMITRGRRRV